MSQTPRTDQNDSLSSRLGFPETTLEIGPTHPAIRRVMTPVGGTASFIVELDDDRITNLEVDIGLLRGFWFACGHQRLQVPPHPWCPSWREHVGQPPSRALR